MSILKQTAQQPHRHLTGLAGALLLTGTLGSFAPAAGDDRKDSAAPPSPDAAAEPGLPCPKAPTPHPFDAAFDGLVRTAANFGVKLRPDAVATLRQEARAAIMDLESTDRTRQERGEQKLEKLKDFVKKEIVRRLSFDNDEVAVSLGDHVDRYYENVRELHEGGLTGARLGNKLFDRAREPAQEKKEPGNSDTIVLPPSYQQAEVIREAADHLLRRRSALDADEDGFITAAEWKVAELPRFATEPAQGERFLERLSRAADRLHSADRNSDGTVSEEEYRTAVEESLDLAAGRQ